MQLHGLNKAIVDTILSRAVHSHPLSRPTMPFNGEENPFRRYIVNMPEENRAICIKIGKDRACGSEDMHCQWGRNPFPAIRDAAYRRTGPPTQATCTKNWQRSRVWFRRYPRGQTDKQTDPQSHRRNPQMSYFSEITSVMASILVMQASELWPFGV